MKIVYLNITYECNSNCSFCAADHEERGQIGRIDYSTIRDILDNIKLSLGDQVIINGGEPTIHPELEEIIATLSERGCLITLFTNGRKLKDKEFAKNLLEKNLYQVSIPLHGNRVIHDKITRCNGSYDETILGIENVKKIEEQKKQTRVELKLVVCNSNISIAKETLNDIINFQVADTILISTLFQTNVACSNEEIVSSKDLTSAIGGLIDELICSDFRGDVILYGFPLCLLTNSQIGYILSNTRKERLIEENIEEIYVDYKTLGEKIERQNNICVILECELHNYCQCGDCENYKMFRKELKPFI